MPHESMISSNNMGDALFRFDRPSKRRQLILDTSPGAPPIRPYDPNEYPRALPFALQHTDDPRALRIFTQTLTFLGGRRQLIVSLGAVNQHSLVFAHKIFYPRQRLTEYEDRWEQIGAAAAMEVFKCVQVQRAVVVKDRSEVIGRVLAEVWALCEGLEDQPGVQTACDEGGIFALRLWKDILFPDSDENQVDWMLAEKKKGSWLGRAADKVAQGGYAMG